MEYNDQVGVPTLTMSYALSFEIQRYAGTVHM